MKNMKKVDFNQYLECEVLKCRSKYATLGIKLSMEQIDINEKKPECRA